MNSTTTFAAVAAVAVAVAVVVAVAVGAVVVCLHFGCCFVCLCFHHAFIACMHALDACINMCGYEINFISSRVSACIQVSSTSGAHLLEGTP